jgi:hypothetical protein
LGAAHLLRLMRVFLVIVPSFLLIVWAIKITRPSPSTQVAFQAQPRAVGPGFKLNQLQQLQDWPVDKL